MIGITTERALRQFNIQTIESYIDQQCVLVTKKILNNSSTRKEKVSTQHPHISIHNTQNKNKKKQRAAASNQHCKRRETVTRTNIQTQDGQKLPQMNIKWKSIPSKLKTQSDFKTQ